MNLKRASSRAAGFHGLLEIRCSDNLFKIQSSRPLVQPATLNRKQTKPRFLSLFANMIWDFYIGDPGLYLIPLC